MNKSISPLQMQAIAATANSQGYFSNAQNAPVIMNPTQGQTSAHLNQNQLSQLILFNNNSASANQFNAAMLPSNPSVNSPASLNSPNPFNYQSKHIHHQNSGLLKDQSSFQSLYSQAQSP